MSNVTNLLRRHRNFSLRSTFYELCRETFEQSQLCRIERLLLLREMAVNFGLVCGHLRPKRGRQSNFSPEEKVALMFLKMKI